MRFVIAKTRSRRSNPSYSKPGYPLGEVTRSDGELCLHSVGSRRAWEKTLLQFYLDRLQAAGGPTCTFDDASKYHRQHPFSTLAWWTSTLMVATTQPRDANLAIIGRIATAIDDLDAMQSFT